MAFFNHQWQTARYLEAPADHTPEPLVQNRFDGVPVAANKVGNAGEMGRGIARQVLKDNIVLTLPLDFSTGGNASRISEQYDLQKDGRIIDGAAAPVIPVIFIESAQVDMVIDELMKGKFKDSRLDLFLTTIASWL